MVRIKGFSLLSSRNYIENVYGKAAVEKVIHSLPPEYQTIFLEPILSTAFYPLDAYVHWLEGEVCVLYDGDETILDRQFLDATEKAVNGIYGMVKRFASPLQAIHGMAAFNMLENVTAERRELEPGRVLLVYRGFLKRHGMYEVVLRNWWLTVVRRTGGTDVRFEPKLPISAGQDRAEYLISWK